MRYELYIMHTERNAIPEYSNKILEQEEVEVDDGEINYQQIAVCSR